MPADSAAHPLRMRPCRDAGNPVMSVVGARYRVAERSSSGRNGRMASDRGGVSVSFVAFRAARNRPLRSAITRDSSHYRLLSCANPHIPASRVVHGLCEPIAVAPLNTLCFRVSQAPSPNPPGTRAPRIIALDSIFFKSRSAAASRPPPGISGHRLRTVRADAS